MVRKSGSHKRKSQVDFYESQVKAMESWMPEAPVEESPKRHKRKKPSYEAELEALESFLPEEPEVKSKGKHKVKREPLWVTPEDIPEEEEEDWFKRQAEGYKKDVQQLTALAESGKKFALGSYKTSQEAVRKAKRLGRSVSRGYHKLMAKFGKHELKKRPVQVFVEPTDEGEYAVYGQFKKVEKPLEYPKQPIKIYTEPVKEEEYVKYGEW